MEFKEIIETAGFEEAIPGLENQPYKNKEEEGTGANGRPKNPVTNSAEELSRGINEEELDDEYMEEPTEEELDQQRNNERDAMNDDNYVAPKNTNDNKK
jgi:hypothetical protein